MLKSKIKTLLVGITSCIVFVSSLGALKAPINNNINTINLSAPIPTEPYVEDVYLEKPLTLTSGVNANTITLTSTGLFPVSWSGYYSTDGTNWNPYTLGTPINLNITEFVSFKGDLTNGCNLFSYLNFSFTGSTLASGNVNSLLSSNDYKNLKDLSSNVNYTGCFYGLFDNCSDLISVSDLMLPATTLTTDCYFKMFAYCGFATPPKLPATNLATGCYASMFIGSSVDVAPKLPATIMKDNCYDSMFQGCSNLKEAPELPATTLAESCYNSMFDSCSWLTSLPELPATELITDCYTNMFANCFSLDISDTQDTSLKYAWKIPSSGTLTNTTTYAQLTMFDSCNTSPTNTGLAGVQGDSYTYYISSLFTQQPSKYNDYTVLVLPTSETVTYQWQKLLFVHKDKVTVPDAVDPSFGTDGCYHSLDGSANTLTINVNRSYSSDNKLYFTSTSSINTNANVVSLGSNNYVCSPTSSASLDTYTITATGSISISDIYLSDDNPNLANETSNRLSATNSKLSYRCKTTIGSEVFYSSAFKTYEIEYVGGTGATAANNPNRYVLENRKINFASDNYTKSGEVITGWNTISDFSGSNFAINDSRNVIMKDYKLTLYAVWASAPTPSPSIVEKTTIHLKSNEQTYRYNGSNIAYIPQGFNHSLDYNIEYLVNNTWSKIAPVNAGSYEVRVTRNADNNYKAFTMTSKLIIKKIKVYEPIVVEDAIYTGSDIKVNLSGLEDCMTTNDSLTQKEVGSYTITFTLDNNHEWMEENDGIITWKIKEKQEEQVIPPSDPTKLSIFEIIWNFIKSIFNK